MTKQIRILTGCHAGARLDLHHGVWRLGNDIDADIQISDWQGEPMVIACLEDGSVSFGPASAGQASTPGAVPLRDLVAQRYGDVVLCVGPSDAPWPSDMTLLQAMLSPDAKGAAEGSAKRNAQGSSSASEETGEAGKTGSMEGASMTQAANGASSMTAKSTVAADGTVNSIKGNQDPVGTNSVNSTSGTDGANGTNGARKVGQAAKRAGTEIKRPGKRGLVSIGACVVTVAGVIGFTMLFTTGQSSKASAAIRAPQPKPPTLAERQLATTQAAVRALHQPDLTVGRSDGRLVVSGIVGTSTDALAATRAIGKLDVGGVDTRFAVADSIAEDLRSTLAEPGIDVAYEGNGAFKVSGVTRDLSHLRTVLSRAKADYGTSIRRIDDDLKETAAPPQNVNAMLSSDDVQYVQLLDGTKDFSATTP